MARPVAPAAYLPSSWYLNPESVFNSHSLLETLCLLCFKLVPEMSSWDTGLPHEVKLGELPSPKKPDYDLGAEGGA